MAVIGQVSPVAKRKSYKAELRKSAAADCAILPVQDLRLVRSKKAIFFTSIALLITTVLILTFGTPQQSLLTDQITATQEKADAANSMAREIRDSYIPQALSIATYSAFATLSEYMRQKGDYFTGPDAELVFNKTLKEIIINGTMCCDLPPGTCNPSLLSEVDDPSLHIGADDCVGNDLMKDKNITKRLADLENASLSAFRLKVKFGMNYDSMNFTVYQNNLTGPFIVGVNLTINYSVAAGDVMVNNTQNISAFFSIEGLPDPLYAVESMKTLQDGGVVYTNYFNATNLTNWNISTFYHQVEWRLYAHDENASSFLDRFYGRDERSPCCGIESLINPVVMSTVNGEVEKPYVDWCYYGPANRCTPATTGALRNITCVTDEDDGDKFFNFAIDTYHAERYNISSVFLDYLYTIGPPPPCPESPFPAP